MKKIPLLLVCGLFFSFLKGSGQVINFPDPNFKAKLLSANENNYIAQNIFDAFDEFSPIDSNNNGEIEISEALLITYLNVEYASISNLSGLQYFSNITAFGCASNPITSLDVSVLPNLNGLYCSNCLITTINFGSNTSLSSLFCQNNQLTSLNLNVFTNLYELNCSNNLLTNLNINQLTTTYIYCSHNLLTQLDMSNSPAGFIDCSYNLLTQLNLTNSSLFSVDCSHNQLSTLNFDGMTDLSTLNCEYNLLSALSVPNQANFYSLNCSNNQLTNIDLNGFQNLTYFYGNNNLMSTINIDGLNNLCQFECNYNLLTEFDLTSNSATVNFSVTNNLLTSLKSKNGVNNTISFANNPNLSFICCDPIEIDTIQYSLDQMGLVNCYATSYCDPESFEPTIQGVFKYDSTSNGCDVNDPIVTDVKLRVDRSSIIRPFYAFNSAPLPLLIFNAFYTLTPVFENSGYFTVTPPIDVLDLYQATTPSNIIRNFCIAPNGTHADLEAVVLPVSDAMPGQNATYKIVYKNKGTHAQSGTISFTFPDDRTDLIAANPTSSGQTANTLTWDFSNLLPFESREITVVLHLNSSSDVPPINNGSTISLGAAISSANNDETPNDNSFNLNQTVVNNPTSNSTSCLQGASIPVAAVGGYVHYLIRFENNTNSVSPNIYLKDIIDTTKLDINSIVPISSSHLGNASVPELYYNGLEVRYKNINLPFDDTTNDGYFAFKIKTLPTLVQGNTFSNSAEVYFWEVPPFTTNMATTFVGSLGEMENVYENTVGFYPNPATDQITFSQNVQSAVIYTIDGKLMPSKLENDIIDVSTLSNGIYIIQITDENGTSISQKLIKN
jgi:hypothetical protein